MQRFRGTAVAALTQLIALAAFAQQTPAPAPDDTPKVNVGATIFTDYTYQESPQVTDANNEKVNFSSFNVSRAYINITGSLNHRISFRITPDLAREANATPSLSGSEIFRVKYAYGQLALDDWTTKGSWLRLGIHQTPFVEYNETLYRYRFQGPIFVDREGFLSSSDAGLSGHWNFPGNYGDVQGGFFNGETYSKAETNNEKAFQLRGTVRPLPLSGMWKGLRLTGFVDADRPVEQGKRDRTIGQISFEHPRVNAAIEYLTAKGKALATSPTVDSKGYSAWVTPRLGDTHWEMLLRHDSLKPNTSLEEKRTHNIIGLAYWVPNLTRVASAVMLDYDSQHRSGVTPTVPDATNYAVHVLISF